MPDEELNEQEVTDVASREAAAEEPEKTEAPAFDADAERAKIRDEESARIREEMEAKYRPQEPAKPQEEQVPDRWADPDAYDAYRDRKLTEQIMDRMGPLLGMVNNNTVEQRFRDAGVGSSGMAYIKQTFPTLNAAMDDKSFEFMANAARFVDAQKQTTPKVTPERPYGERGSVDITDRERSEYGIGTKYGPTEAEVRAWKKEELEINRR